MNFCLKKTLFEEERDVVFVFNIEHASRGNIILFVFYEKIFLFKNFQDFSSIFLLCLSTFRDKLGSSRREWFIDYWLHIGFSWCKGVAIFGISYGTVNK